jgi:hypothetical protein
VPILLAACRHAFGAGAGTDDGDADAAHAMV